MSSVKKYKFPNNKADVNKCHNIYIVHTDDLCWKFYSVIFFQIYTPQISSVPVEDTAPGWIYQIY